MMNKTKDSFNENKKKQEENDLLDYTIEDIFKAAIEALEDDNDCSTSSKKGD